MVFLTFSNAGNYFAAADGRLLALNAYDDPFTALAEDLVLLLFLRRLCLNL
jgi:hypothetical protein